MTDSHIKKTTKRLWKDEEGVMMVEYVILLTTMVVAMIWLNKIADTVLFGADPSRRFGDPTKTEATANVDLYLTPDGQQYVLSDQSTRTREIFQSIGGSEGPEKAYLSQVYIHLARP